LLKDKIFWKETGKEALIACFKGLPVAGRAVDIISHAEKSYRLLQLESKTSNNQKHIQEVRNTIQQILDTIRLQHVTTQQLQSIVNKFVEVKSSGYLPAVFDDLIFEGGHRSEFVKNPSHYGRVLNAGDTIDLNSVQLVVNLSGPKLVEISPFVLTSLFGVRVKHENKPKILTPGDIWVVNQPKKSQIAHRTYGDIGYTAMNLKNTHKSNRQSTERALKTSKQTFDHYSSKKLNLLYSLSNYFITGKNYTEHGVKAIIKDNIRSRNNVDKNDPRLETTHLLRGLIELGILSRKQDGSVYWKRNTQGE